MAQAHGLTLKPTGVQGELVTPTGAAIVAAVRTSDKLPQTCRIVKIGMGAGKREYEGTGILRAMLLESGSAEAAGRYEYGVSRAIWTIAVEKSLAL